MRNQIAVMSEFRKDFDQIKEHLHKGDALPEVYINSSEAQRILNVSANLIIFWRKEGLLTHHKNQKCQINRYLLSEVWWLKKQKYMFMTPIELTNLIKKRKVELGF
ncbi:hypothetical protein LZD49_07175 [Dyadobacter sp. CY261]|uniref:hypothetical protein n=1 Tax=Dyadobacter sp. CY261 TaxID=2907203 RepID=UPI001F187001|nr:hypothetical protein [Dyadobacter sp. CY261]MCF0070247.1 hypothetical protein [Dyadobacter sp. CY261]